jgi:CubicO group peptidase (beta-lactamase class C family)
MVRQRKRTNSKQYLFCLVCFLFLFAGCATKNDDDIESHIGLGSISKDAIDNFLASKMEKLKIPGLSIAVINKGKVVHQKTMGYADVEEKLPITRETIFEGASLSTSVFAFFVMTYVEEGRLSLDKPLYEYLP